MSHPLSRNSPHTSPSIAARGSFSRAAVFAGTLLLTSHFAYGQSTTAACCSMSENAGTMRHVGWYQRLGLQDYDFFTNFGSYMPRTHCLQTAEGGADWPWIGILIALTTGVIAAYARIFLFWRNSYLSEAAADRNTKLMDLAWIFVLCAVCGYAMSIMMFVWPAYRLLAVFLVLLNVCSWRFTMNLSAFKVSFAATRMQRELEAARSQRVEQLERLVHERTEQLEIARKVAEDASAAKSMFLANMSHEVRTPLTSVLGFAELLTDPVFPEAERTRAAHSIVHQGHHLMKVLNDILDLSKIEAGQLSIERSACSTWELVTDVINLMRVRAEMKGLNLSATADFPLPTVITTDPVRLRQALCNLIGNAIKFTQSGEVRVNVSCGLANEVSQIRFDVIDTGIGLSQSQIECLFRPFAQADPSIAHRYGGTGLGLTISRKLARLLGGDLSCKSTPNRGSTFSLTIDAGDQTGVLHAEDASQLTSGDHGMSSPAVTAHAAPSALGMRVLVADDSVDNQRLVSFMLNRAGASVELVENGRQAVEAGLRAAQANQPYDLILMDVHMPELDGLGAVRELRAAGYTLPIAALTASAMNAERLRCLEAGCDEFLTKPIDHAALNNACQRMNALAFDRRTGGSVG